MSRVVSVEVEQVGPSTGQARARTHTVSSIARSRRAAAIGAPLAGSLLMSLGGCFLSTLLAAVRTREADVSDVRVSVMGTVGGVPERFESMALRVSGNTATTT